MSMQYNEVVKSTLSLEQDILGLTSGSAIICFETLSKLHNLSVSQFAHNNSIYLIGLL